MFRRKVKSIAELLPEFLRKEGLETPLQQKRLIMSWDSVVGKILLHIVVRSLSRTRLSM